MTYKGVPVPVLEDAVYQRISDINIQDSVEERLIEDLYALQEAIDIHAADKQRWEALYLAYDDDHDPYAAKITENAWINATDRRDSMIKTISYLLGPLYAQHLIDKVLERINNNLPKRSTL